MPVALTAFRWHPVRQMKKIASMARQLSTQGPAPPKRWKGSGRRSGTIRSHRASGMRHRVSLAMRGLLSGWQDGRTACHLTGLSGSALSSLEA